MPDEIVTVEARVKDRIQRESYVGIHFQELQLESIFEDEAEEEKVTEAVKIETEATPEEPKSDKKEEE